MQKIKTMGPRFRGPVGQRENLKGEYRSRGVGPDPPGRRDPVFYSGVELQPTDVTDVFGDLRR